MTVAVPSWWTFVLLTLGAYRVYRIVARDTITEPLRAAVSMPDATAVTLDDLEGSRVLFTRAWLDDRPPHPLVVYVATLIRCPWCLGFYVSVAAWVAWDVAPSWTTFLAVPFAMSAVVGLLSKNLDR